MVRSTRKRKRSRMSTRGLTSRKSLNGKRLKKALRPAERTRRQLRRGIL
jgi:hypothetical protein